MELTPMSPKSLERYADLTLALAATEYVQCTTERELQHFARLEGFDMTLEQAGEILLYLLRFADDMVNLSRLPDSERFPVGHPLCDGVTR